MNASFTATVAARHDANLYAHTEEASTYGLDPEIFGGEVPDQPLKVEWPLLDSRDGQVISVSVSQTVPMLCMVREERTGSGAS